MPDPWRILVETPEDLSPNLTYRVQLVRILERELRRLRSKDVWMLKVLWQSPTVEEVTWESEVDMQRRYPHLFE